MYAFTMNSSLIDLASQLKALGDPTRLDLVIEVASSENSEACVCDLTDIAGLTQGTVSHHLRVLVESGILEREQRSKWAYYSLSDSGKDLVKNLNIGRKTKKTKKNC
jgi:ArsR family transcriptional regulator